MRQRAPKALAFVVLVGLAAVVRILWSDRDGRGAATIGLQSAGSGSIEAGLRTAAQPPDIERPSIATRTFETSEVTPSAHRVVFFDARTGAPVAGAEVQWATVEALESAGIPAHRPLCEFPDRWSGDLTGRRVTDANGSAVVPPSVLAGIATTRQLEARFVVNPEAREQRIPMFERCYIDIETIRADGSPVEGVVVTLSHQGSCTGCLVGVARADPSGRATLSIPAPGTLPAEKFAGEGSFHLEAHVTGAMEPPIREIDVRNLPSQPVTLVVPESGKVVVDLFDREGVPIPDGTVSLMDNDIELLLNGIIVLDEASGAASIEFPHVALDRTWTLSASSSAGHRFPPCEITGPRFPGETVRVRRDAAGQYPSLLLDLVDERGNALSGRVVEVQLSSRGEVTRREHWTLRTDGAGHVERAIHARDDETWTASIVVAGSPPLRASIESFKVPSEGVLDLGRISCMPALLLVRGRVFDEACEPVLGATVSLGLLDSVSTNACGEFEMWTWSEVRPTLGGLEVVKPGFVRVEREGVRTGTTDLRITLRSDR